MSRRYHGPGEHDSRRTHQSTGDARLLFLFPSAAHFYL